MNDTHRVSALFHAAAEIRSPQDREEYLQKACEGKPELRHRIEKLLQAHFDCGSFLESGQPMHISLENDPVVAMAMEGEGAVVDRYVLKEELGSGGFGVVFLAEQQLPVQRLVALKLVKPGMETEELIARFHVERQALAMMDHPTIAKIFDAGTSPSGRPYFVMEWVDGIPVTEYCDRHCLSVEERLELMIQIGEGVQHAHQKGIIHRDIKPGNILVSSKDGLPVPKLIDFGVAKTVDWQNQDDAVRTAGGQRVGTPLYMSPEQAARTHRDIDVRSDIYSLGVVLFELLTGTTPVRNDDSKTWYLDEIFRQIREGDYPLASRRLQETTELQPEISHHRNSTPGKLVSQVQGDLDWIVKKSLETSPDHRYESAGAFARDIRRFLDGDLVKATPATNLYRLRKFARKNKKSLAVAVAFVAVLMITTAISINLSIIATTALKSEREALQSEQSRRRYSEDMLSYVSALLHAPLPLGDGHKLTMVDWLHSKKKQLSSRYPQDPETRAALLLLLGRSYRGIGLTKDAMPVLEEAWVLAAQQFGKLDRRTLEALHSLTSNCLSLNDLERSLELGQELLAKEQELPEAESQFPRTLTLLGNIYQQAGNHGKAREVLDKAVDLARQKYGDQHLQTIHSIQALAYTLHMSGEKDQAMKLRQQVYEWSQEMDIENYWRISLLNELGVSYSSFGREKEVLPLRKEVIELTRELLPENDRQLPIFLYNLATDQVRLGYYYDAIPNFEEALQLMKQYHEDQIDAIVAIGTELTECLASGPQQHHRAAKLGEEMVKLSVKSMGENHNRTFRARRRLAVALFRSGERSRGLKLMETVLEHARKKKDRARFNRLAAVMHELASLYHAMERHVEAVDLRVQALEIRKQQKGTTDQMEYQVSKSLLGTSYLQSGQTQKGIQYLQESLEWFRAEFDGQFTTGAPRSIWRTASALAKARAGQGEFPGAIALMEETIQQQLEFHEKENQRTVLARSLLAQIFVDAGSMDQATRQFQLIDKTMDEICLQFEQTVPGSWKSWHNRHLKLAIKLDRAEYLMKEHNTKALPLLESTETALTDSLELLNPANETLSPELVRDMSTKYSDLIIRMYQIWERPEEAARWEESRSEAARGTSN